MCNTDKDYTRPDLNRTAELLDQLSNDLRAGSDLKDCRKARRASDLVSDASLFTRYYLEDGDAFNLWGVTKLLRDAGTELLTSKLNAAHPMHQITEAMDDLVGENYHRIQDADARARSLRRKAPA